MTTVFFKQFLLTTATFDYLGFEQFSDYEFIHTLIVLFFVFLFHVVLLNFLIGIMSTTYSILTEQGSFLFKVNLY